MGVLRMDDFLRAIHDAVIDAGAKRVVMVSALLTARSILDYARCVTDMLA